MDGNSIRSVDEDLGCGIVGSVWASLLSQTISLGEGKTCGLEANMFGEFVLVSLNWDRERGRDIGRAGLCSIPYVGPFCLGMYDRDCVSVLDPEYT